MLSFLLNLFRRPQDPPAPIPALFTEAEFIAIDFETATGKRNSACSIGMAAGKAGKIEGTYVQLLRPPGNRYLAANIAIHRINPSQTANAPTIADLYHQGLAHIIDAEVPLVAHNASFDMSVLRESLAHHGIELPWINATCTVDLARTMYPTLKNHKLNTVARHLKYPLVHHDPTSDAMAAAEIMFRWQEKQASAKKGKR